MTIIVIKDIPAKLNGYYNLPHIPKGTIIKDALFDKASERKLYKQQGDRYYIGFNSCVHHSYVEQYNEPLI